MIDPNGRNGVTQGVPSNLPPHFSYAVAFDGSVAVMDKLEERARAICAQDLLAAGCWPTELEEKVDRLWPVVAFEITGGAVDSVFAHIADLDSRQREYDAMVRRAPGAAAGSSFQLMGADQSKPDR
ncbi:hypothetical protein [Ancylobacter oerskovii]|uniref:Uncharacterized protein n=1 Tax=Ancylobacter oerskovii TaxID=459519 RepID=A0ABW4YVR5_9HYPH|nr:hypothetical protein [Ancylobacter oerskovii]MBS7543194.1 hypothetical protein [Ancylobacter oerskovii]